MSGQARQTGFPASGGAGWSSDQTATWRGGGGNAWWHPKALLALDFVNDRAFRCGAEPLLTSALALTRAGNARMLDAHSVWQSFASNLLARIGGMGADLHGGYTNKIRNPRGEGGTAGVIGSGGALPTYWATAGVPSGVSVAFLGAGEEGGLPYCDIRFFGTAGSAAASNRVHFNDNANATATAGQAWGLDFRAKLIAGTAPDAMARLAAYATGSLLAGANDSGSMTLDGTVKYLSVRKVLADPTANNARGALVVPLANGVSYDFTIRIYAPKLVQLPVLEGPEIVVNGSLASDTVWTKGNGWTIAAGSAEKAATSSSSLSQSAALVPGQTYKVSMALVRLGGNFRFRIAGGANVESDDFSSTGTYTRYLTAVAGNNTFGVFATGGFSAGSVDDVSCRDVSAGYMPVFPILPVAGAPGDSTRAADVAVAQDFASWVTPVIGAGASALVAGEISHTGDGAARVLFEYSDGSATNVIRGFIGTANKPSLLIVSGGVTQVTCELSVPAATGLARFAFGWGAGGGYIADQAGNTATFGAVTLPAGLSQWHVGGGLAGQYVNDRLRQMQIGQPLTLAEAQTWTAAA